MPGSRARSFLFRAEARHAFSRPGNSLRGQFGAGDFLDLAGGARTVVDHGALTEPQFGNVLLARKDLIRGRRRGHHGGVNAAAFSADGKLVLTSSYDSSVCLWDLAARKERQKLLEGMATMSVAFAPNGRWMAAGCGDGTVRATENTDAASELGDAPAEPMLVLPAEFVEDNVPLRMLSDGDDVQLLRPPQGSALSLTRSRLRGSRPRFGRGRYC